ncbi:NAD(P)(+) transhydrogenase (Re/Si-specific) subunit beta [Cytophagaceae bacterium ABcell3]|nr:NAD(P)(+) transhydrogenase (Re/Si-specific) subunit beta [Cytophagaceae bacterium ABcell3]
MDQKIIIQIVYLTASVLFITGIKMLGKTHTARKGNAFSAIAMFLAIAATLFDNRVLSFAEIFAAVLVGSVIGVYVSKKVEMTAMPEMVAIFNGLGGGASVFVALSEYFRVQNSRFEMLDSITGVTVALSIFIGALTFSGSLIAFGKLSGTIKGGAFKFAGQHPLNAVLLLMAVAAASMMVVAPDFQLYMIGLLGAALLLGVLTVMPIGGADMPVVISLLNSYSGIAACATGFVLNNQLLIITGSLVGASGIILTQIMCKAMNRSLVNVLLGGFGQAPGEASSGGSGSDMVVKEVGVEEAAMIFDSASSVIIVPGYGMAVAQAQHVVKEMSDLLEGKNIDVRFAIHPVAGRMPGHMNVLLAEANVPYDKLVEMEMINDDFSNCDVVLVIGANDVVNPAAKTNPGSPIYGMPVLNVEKARTVIVSKRSMASGYAGIENELFGSDNCLMLFGDAKVSLTKVVGELKSTVPA